MSPENLVSTNRESLYQTEADRNAALYIDRYLESIPLPGQGNQYLNEDERQLGLAVAERANIARSAGQLGLTSEEWKAKRTELGRSPTPEDIF